MQTRYSKSTVCLHIPDTGNMWRQEWRRMKRHTKSATDGGDIYLPRTWMNHLYYYWTLERGKEIEKVGARKKKKEAELSLYFSFLQRFSNVISMLLLLEVWLSKQRDREREVETETPTERWLRDERTEGSREAETKWESRKEREPKRLHCCSTVESQRQLSHMSANRDGEWVKGIVGLFIDIKTTRFDCAETGEAVWKQVQDKDLLRNCLRSFTDGKNPPICFVFFSTAPEVITDWSDHSVRQPERERGRKRAWQTETRVYLLKQPFTAFQTRILR